MQEQTDIRNLKREYERIAQDICIILARIHKFQQCISENESQLHVKRRRFEELGLEIARYENP